MERLKIFAAVLILMTIIFSSVEAAEKPLRLLRLPIILQKNIPDAETCAVLEKKIARAVAIPLNGTLNLVEYVDPKNSSVELNDIWKKMRAKNKKLKLAETMRPLAKKLDADIIVCPILLRYSEYYVQFGVDFHSHLVSDVSAELIVYDRRTDELIDKKTSRHFNNSSSRFGRASYLALDCFDRLIKETNLRRKIMAIK